MFLFPCSATPREVIREGSPLTDTQIIEKEIQDFKLSQRRKLMLDGQRYFNGDHDILRRKRLIIGQNGDLEEVKNLPNNRIVDNQYKKMVVQKNNYLLGQPISIQCENDTYAALLREIFDKRFQRLIKNVGEDSLNSGIGWLYIYYDEAGNLAFKRLRPYEVIPGWSDAEHTVLDYAIRVYEVIAYSGKQEQIVEKVEVYEPDGVSFFVLEGGRLVAEPPFRTDYFTVFDSNIEKGYNWVKFPLVAFKYNSHETPLIKSVKSLQDGLNLILSNFQNNMEEDSRNTILVIENFDGENLGEFRQNLATYGAVKVLTGDGAKGGVSTLQVEVNSENYKAILELFKKAIIENAMGYDAKDDRMAGNPNQMNIQSMYSDIDLDANGMETEYQASFEELLWFVNCHLSNTGRGDFEGVKAEIIFNRDMLISEAEIIDNCGKSSDLSLETRIANHPWVDDPTAELRRIKKEQAEQLQQYGGTFDVLNSKAGELLEE